MESLSDAELIESAVKHGDSHALRTLLDRHYHTVYAFAFKWCGHRQDAEDVAQEVCIKVARSLDSFKGHSAFTSWLYQITLNKSRDLFRSRQAAREREAGYVAFQDATETAPATPEENAQREEALAAIATLPDDLKSTVLLVAGEGLTHKEAGKILDCAEGTIAWRMNKAKERLARKLGGTS